MATFFLLLMVAAFVCFVLATFNVAVRFNLVAFGLALWALVFVIQGFRSLT